MGLNLFLMLNTPPTLSIPIKWVPKSISPVKHTPYTQTTTTYSVGAKSLYIPTTTPRVYGLLPR